MFDEITRVDAQKARQALNNIITAEEKIALAKACGIPCQDEDERCQHWKGVCTEFLAQVASQYPERK